MQTELLCDSYIIIYKSLRVYTTKNPIDNHSTILVINW